MILLDQSEVIHLTCRHIYKDLHLCKMILQWQWWWSWQDGYTCTMGKKYYHSSWKLLAWHGLFSDVSIQETQNLILPVSSSFRFLGCKIEPRHTRKTVIIGPRKPKCIFWWHSIFPTIHSFHFLKSPFEVTVNVESGV